MNKIKIGKGVIGGNNHCFIIAEAGVNHDGDIEKAKKLIDIAVWSGADAVKFQTWKTEKLVMMDAPKAEYQKEQTGEEGSQFEMIKKLELSYDQFSQLKVYCEQKGIIFMSTPDEEESAKFLFEVGVPVFKIGSGELDNLLYLKRVANYGKPMIISAGMGTIEEVQRAKEEIFGTENKRLIILHCTTDYPTKPEDVNLLAMRTIGDKLGVMVGYSDHTLGTDVALLAVHLGAKVVEKHFTYDKKAEGPDHSASLSPEELKEMVKRIREYEASNLKEREKIISKINDKEIIFGSGKKEPCKREMVHIPVIRKSIVALREINSGETISEEMLIMKRAGGDGISAAEYKSLIGAIAEVKIMKDTLISWDEVKRR